MSIGALTPQAHPLSITGVGPAEVVSDRTVTVEPIAAPLPKVMRRAAPHPSSMAGVFGFSPRVIAGAMAAAILTMATLTPGAALAERARTAEEVELTTKLSELVDGSYGGNLAAAFGAYDKRGGDQALDRGELESLLRDADVGNPLTRGMWVRGIIKKMDGLPGAEKNGKVDWRELETILGR